MRFPAVIALFALAGCTVPDMGWHMTTRYRGPAENYSLPRTSMRAVPGAQKGEAIYLRRVARGPVADPRIGPEAHFANFGGLERNIPLQAWRGSKVQLSVRLKNEGNALAFVIAQINRLDGDALYTGVEGNAPGDNGRPAQHNQNDAGRCGRGQYTLAQPA